MTVEIIYCEFAGYDCMTGGWRITIDDKDICTIDEGYFDTKEQAEYFARLIAQRLS